jgi:hypothetical protein
MVVSIKMVIETLVNTDYITNKEIYTALDFSAHNNLNESVRCYGPADK